MTIDWQIIPHSQQRYPTVGDWWTSPDTWHFRVSTLNNFHYECLVFIHELIEFLVCFLASVAPDAVDRFDIEYEEARSRGLERAPCGCALHDEPGDDPHAPYHRAHMIAELCEFAVGKIVGVNWKEYCRRIDEVCG